MQGITPTANSTYPAGQLGPANSEQRLMGSIVQRNTIIGTNQRALQVGGTYNNYNSIVIRNTPINNHAQAVFNQSSGNSFVDFNDVITTAELASYIQPQIPAYKHWLENLSLY